MSELNRYQIRIEIEATTTQAENTLEKIRDAVGDPHAKIDIYETDIYETVTNLGNTYDVLLTGVKPGRKIQTIKLVRAYAIGLGLKEAKDYVDAVAVGKPMWVMRGVTEENARKCVHDFEVEGADAQLWAAHLAKRDVDHAITGLKTIERELAKNS